MLRPLGSLLTEIKPDKDIAEGGVTVNWIRMVLDGIMMAAYFNLFAAAVALYDPRLMFPCYPSSIIKDARGTSNESRELFLYVLDLFRGNAAPYNLRRGQYDRRRNPGIRMDGAVWVYPVDDDWVCGSILFRCLVDPEKM